MVSEGPCAIPNPVISTRTPGGTSSVISDL